MSAVLCSSDKNACAVLSRHQFQLELFQNPEISAGESAPSQSAGRRFSSIDLFAGAGGLSIGLEKAGFDPVLLNDFNPDACRTLRLNKPQWNVVCSSIVEIDFTPYKGIDLISGGPPCQSFSRAGLELGDEDPRGLLYLQYLRAVKETEPKALLMENVPRLLTFGEGRVINNIKRDLAQIGYRMIVPRILDAQDYGVPQSRKRTILMAAREDLFDAGALQYPERQEKQRTVRDVFFPGDLYETACANQEGFEYTRQMREIMSHVPAGGNWTSLPTVELKQAIMGKLWGDKGSTGVAHRVSLDKPCRTLTCSPIGRMTHKGHPTELRPLSVQEYARIQTFPDSWVFCGSISSKYKQIGNAVPCLFAQQLGAKIREFLAT